MDIFSYMMQNSGQVLDLLLEHIRLTAVAVGLAILVGVPLGILISYVKSLNKPILGITNLIQAVPSMALLGFAIPLLGIGTIPAVGVVFLYSLLPIVRNTYAGLCSVPPSLLEAANGIGMTKWQRLRQVELPAAWPVMLSGIRIATAINVGTAPLAFLIGANSLGSLIFPGIALNNQPQLLLGAACTALLALLLDGLVTMASRLWLERGLRPS